MKTVNITKIKKMSEIFMQYPSQTEPQDMYISLDLEDGELTASYNGEIGNAVPSNVWHGHTRRYYFPGILSVESINSIMAELKPLAQKIIDGYESVYNGNNYVARLSPDAITAEEELENIVSNTEGEYTVWSAGEWLCNSDLSLTADTDIDELAAQLKSDAESENVIFSDSVVDYLEDLKSDLA